MSDEQSETPDPIVLIQNVVAELDPSALVVGLAVAVDWLEEDGSRSMTVMHTSMPPWQLHGLMTYARDHHCVDFTGAVGYFVDEDDDED